MKKKRAELCLFDDWFDRVLFDFSIHQRVPKKVEAAIIFPQDFPAFSGHFPEESVLPAIVQLLFIRKLTEKALGKQFVPSVLHRVKFSGVIRPDEKISLLAKVTEETDQVVVDFSIRRKGKNVATGTVIYTTR